MNERVLCEIVREAWSRIDVPPRENMVPIEWSAGKDGVQAFVGVPPVEVDVSSPGFVVAEPLLDLPPQAAAAYLGSFLLSLLDGLKLQKEVDFSDDIITRAHTLFCLTSPQFWDEVIRKFLPLECQKAVVQITSFLIFRRDDLALSQKDVDILQDELIKGV